MLAGDSFALGVSVSDAVAVDGSQLTSAFLAVPIAQACRASDRGIAVLSPMGPAPYRVSPRHPALDRGTRAGSLPDAAAGASGQIHGSAVRKPAPIRYEVAAPGELVHVDIKKLGRIPDGGGHRMLGRQAGKQNNDGHGRGGRGYAFLHHAVDDHSRLAYSEILEDERKETAAAFWERANAIFAASGVLVTAVMTDNGSCYRSAAFAAALGENVKHRRTRAYRPQTNGKVERFNRTLAAEWAYAAVYDSDEARAATYDTWLHHYNHHRPHTGIGGQVPSARVHNLTGKNI